MTEEVTAWTGGGGDTSDRARSVLPVLTDTDRPRAWEMGDLHRPTQALSPPAQSPAFSYRLIQDNDFDLTMIFLNIMNNEFYNPRFKSVIQFN